MTLQELKTQRDDLRSARATGVKTTRFGNDEVTFKSDSEMKAAIADLDAQIALMERGARPRTFSPRTSKGFN